MSLIEIPDPPGYRVVCFGTPRKGQRYLSANGNVCVASRDYQTANYPVLEAVEVWRDATIDDLKRVPCKARFSDLEQGFWTHGSLHGWELSAAGALWINSAGMRYEACQVLEHPQ